MRCEQKITLLNREITISEPTDVGDCAGEIILLPWGRYRYQHGELRYLK